MSLEDFDVRSKLVTLRDGRIGWIICWEPFEEVTGKIIKVGLPLSVHLQNIPNLSIPYSKEDLDPNYLFKKYLSEENKWQH